MAVGGNRAIKRGHGRALNGQLRGTALTEQDGAARTTGSGLGQRRAGARAKSEVREARQAEPQVPGHHAQQHLPRWPGRTAVQPDGGGTPHGTWPRPETERVKRLRTNTSARL